MTAVPCPGEFPELTPAQWAALEERVAEFEAAWRAAAASRSVPPRISDYCLGPASGLGPIGPPEPAGLRTPIRGAAEGTGRSNGGAERPGSGDPPAPAGWPPIAWQLLIELSHADLEFRLRAGEPARVEDYLAAYPELARPEVVSGLAKTEYRLRRRSEPGLPVDEYGCRFPDLTGLFAALLGRAHDERLSGGHDSDGADSRSDGLAIPTGGGPASGGGLSDADPAGRPPDPPGYELIEALGRGGMGVVYKAVDVRLNRAVAVKTVRPDAGPAEVERLRSEAKAAASLQHPNVVQVHQVLSHRGRLYVVSEYLVGGTLAERAQSGPLPAGEAAAFVEPIARAVGYAHSRGVVHRDLKPSNVLLAADGTPKVADFGLARRTDADSGRLTAADVVAGSPCYMAPEQAEGMGAGPPADVYGLGAVLYELLTGRPPLRGATALETLTLARTADPVPPRRLVPGTPLDLETVCLKCLEKEPSRRYGSATALADDLARFVRGEPVLARPPGPIGRARRWAKRNRATAALLVALLVGSVGGTARLGVYASRLGRAVKDRDGALAAQSAARSRAEASEQNARLLLLASDMTAAAEAVRGGDPARAAELLAAHDTERSGPGAFVLNYLGRLCQAPGVRIDDLGGPAYHLAVSPGGKTLAACGAAGEVRLYDVGSWAPVGRRPAGQGEVNGLAFSPDGARLATAGDDGTVRLWDVASGRPLWRVRAFGKPAYQVAFGLGGAVLAACGNEPIVRLLDPADGRRLAELGGVETAVEAITVTPDGRTLLGAGYGGEALAWDLASRDGLWRRADDGSGSLASVACSADGRYAAFGSRKASELLVVRLPSGAVAHQGPIPGRDFRQGASYRCLAFLTSGRVAVGDDQGRVHLFDLDGEGRVRVASDVPRDAWTAGGARLASLAGAGDDIVSADWDGVVSAWRPTADAAVKALGRGGSSPRATAWVAEASGEAQVAITDDRELVTVDPESGRRVTLAEEAGAWSSVAADPPGRKLFAGTSAGGLDAFEIRDGRAARVWTRQFRPPRVVELSPGAARGGRLAVILAADRAAEAGPTVAVLDASTGRTIAERVVERTWFAAVASPGGTLVAGAVPRAVTLLDARTLRPVAEFHGFDADVRTVSFSPGGALLAAGGGDGRVILWDVAARRELRSWRADVGRLTSVTFDPGGRLLATASDDRPVRIWDVTTGRLLLDAGPLPAARFPDGSPSGWSPVVFSPDGTRLAAGRGAAAVLFDGRPPTVGGDAGRRTR